MSKKKNSSYTSDNNSNGTGPYRNIFRYPGRDDFTAPMVVLYGVPNQYDYDWPPKVEGPYVLPVPSVPDPTVTIGPVLSAERDDRFDFLKPLLDLGVDAKTACVLWARFHEASLAIIGLARLIGKKPLEIVDDPKLFSEAVDALADML